MDPVSTAQRGQSGVSRARREPAPGYGSGAAEESWPGANEAKAEKLLLRSLKREAGVRGLEIRHSDYGYALIGATARRASKERSNLTLDEVKSRLDAAFEQ